MEKFDKKFGSAVSFFSKLHPLNGKEMVHNSKDTVYKVYKEKEDLNYPVKFFNSLNPSDLSYHRIKDHNNTLD